MVKFGGNIFFLAISLIFFLHYYSLSHVACILHTEYCIHKRNNTHWIVHCSRLANLMSISGFRVHIRLFCSRLFYHLFYSRIKHNGIDSVHFFIPDIVNFYNGFFLSSRYQNHAPVPARFNSQVIGKDKKWN